LTDGTHVMGGRGFAPALDRCYGNHCCPHDIKPRRKVTTDDVVGELLVSFEDQGACRLAYLTPNEPKEVLITKSARPDPCSAAEVLAIPFDVGGVEARSRRSDRGCPVRALLRGPRRQLPLDGL